MRKSEVLIQLERAAERAEAKNGFRNCWTVTELRFVDAKKERAIHLACGKMVRVKGLIHPLDGRYKKAVILRCEECDLDIRLTPAMFEKLPTLRGQV